MPTFSQKVRFLPNFFKVYNIIMTSLTYPDSSTVGCTNILLIDTSVKESSLFYTSVNANTFPIMYSRNSTKNDLLTLLEAKFTTIQRVAFVFHNKRVNTFLDNKPFFLIDEPTSAPFSENVDFLITLFNQFNVQNVDYLACNTLNFSSWSKYYQLLTNSTGIIVGASNDQTGNIKYGGDWIMENTSENIELIYFTKSIEYYTYLLDTQGYNLIAFKQNGTIWGTGNNDHGQLGIALDNTTSQPVLTAMNTTTIEGRMPKSICCGESYTIILMTDVTIWGTGDNFFGQLGISNTNDKSVLTPMNTTTIEERTPKYISCGDNNTMVLMTDGTIWGTGRNNFGQLGIGTTSDVTVLTPMNTTTIEGRKAIFVSCGFTHTMVLMSDGTVWGTGSNSFGQLGIGNTTQQTVLTPINTSTIGEKKAISISCGGYYTMVLMSDGTVWGTGINSNGELGIGNTTNKLVLAPINTSTIEGKTPKYISCGGYHTMVLMTDGTIWGTGFNSDGELGIDNTMSPQLVLTPMNTTTIEGRTPKSISCTEENTYVLMTDGTIWGTGSNSFGQLGIANNADKEVLTIMGQNNNNIKYISNMIEDENISNICFPAGTPVLTDQGIIAIDKINIDVNTIHNKKIVDITKTISKETFLVCFDKDALGLDIPSQETIISPGHQLMYEGEMRQAKWFIEKFPKVKSIPYTGETLYNVLMEKHEMMNVNNLICETLLPDNPIAKFYTKQCKLTPQNRDIMVKILSDCWDRKDYTTYNQIMQYC